MASQLHPIKAPVTGSVWVHSASVGQTVYAGNVVLVMESMKMEMPLESPVDGVVKEMLAPGTNVNEGDVVAIVEV